MKNDAKNTWESKLLDWAFKGLLGVTLYLVKDMHADIKDMRQQIPAMKAEIDNLKDRELLERFRLYKATKDPMKEEPIATYDTLINQNRTI